MTQNIYVTGQPRSGNTWLNRLLGDALSSPLRAHETNVDNTPSYVGAKQDGEYMINKMHHLAKPDDGPIVFIQRDPRDVIVARRHYRKNETIQQIVDSMLLPSSAEEPTRTQEALNYVDWIHDWTHPPRYEAATSYEALHEIGWMELARILQVILPNRELSLEDIGRAWADQSFDAVVAREGESFAMRKGIVGDWRNHFTCDDGRYMQTTILGAFMLEMGYIQNEYWYEELK